MWQPDGRVTKDRSRLNSAVLVKGTIIQDLQTQETWSPAGLGYGTLLLLMKHGNWSGSIFEGCGRVLECWTWVENLKHSSGDEGHLTSYLVCGIDRHDQCQGKLPYLDTQLTPVDLDGNPTEGRSILTLILTYFNTCKLLFFISWKYFSIVCVLLVPQCCLCSVSLSLGTRFLHSPKHYVYLSKVVDVSTVG